MPLELEGIVATAKRANSPYSVGRSDAWQKVKTTAGEARGRDTLNAAHENQMIPICEALRQLHIEGFRALSDGSVEIAGYWPLWKQLNAERKMRAYDPARGRATIFRVRLGR